MRREPTPSLGQRLRSVGQALEGRHVQDFELSTAGPDILIRGTEGPLKPNEPPTTQPTVESAGFELRFTPEDLDRLDREGRTRRQDAVSMPEMTLSQLLRTIGDYLDRQGHQLLRIVRQGTTTTIEYRTQSGQRNTEERTASSLYDLSVRMYLRRAYRP